MSLAHSLETPEADNSILAELRRVRAEQSAAYGYDVGRRIADTRRLTFLFGNDVVSGSKTGELQVIFKGTGKIDVDRAIALARGISATATGEPQDG